VRLARRVPALEALVGVERQRLLNLGEASARADAGRDAARDVLEVAQQVGRVPPGSGEGMPGERVLEVERVDVVSASTHAPTVGARPPGSRRTCRMSALNTARSSGKCRTALSSAWAVPRWIIVSRFPPERDRVPVGERRGWWTHVADRRAAISAPFTTSPRL
jgi:hypothetical protein